MVINHIMDSTKGFDQYIGSTFTLFLEPILNTYTKTYQNVITLSDTPQGPLQDHICQIRTEKLSPFQQEPITSNNPFNCTRVLCRYPTKDQQRNFSQKSSNLYMGQDDIPAVFSYLRANGYSIDTELTKIMNKSGLKSTVSTSRISGIRQMICIVNYQI